MFALIGALSAIAFIADSRGACASKSMLFLYVFKRCWLSLGALSATACTADTKIAFALK